MEEAIVAVFVHYSPRAFDGLTLVRIDSFDELPNIGHQIQITPGWNEIVNAITWVNEVDRGKRRARLHIFCYGQEEDVIPPDRFLSAGFGPDESPKSLSVTPKKVG